MKLALTDSEAANLEDVIGMYIEGLEAEVPSLAQTDGEAHWSTFQMRRQREQLANIKLRIQLERRDNGNEADQRRDQRAG